MPRSAGALALGLSSTEHGTPIHSRAFNAARRATVQSSIFSAGHHLCYRPHSTNCPQQSGFHVATTGTKILRAARVSFPGSVVKIGASLTGEPETAEIRVEGAEPLYCDIRIPNALLSAKGEIHTLKRGDRVTITVTA